MTRRSLEMLAAIVFLALAIFLFFECYHYQENSRLLPFYASIVMMVCAMIWLGQLTFAGFRKIPTDSLQITPVQLRRMIAFLIYCIIYIIIFTNFGLFTATILCVPIGIVALGYRVWPVISITLVVLAGILYLVFVKILNASLPPEFFQ